MDTIEVVCPACRQRVNASGIVCPRCGASVASEVFAARAEAIRQIAARAPKAPPRSGGSTVNGWGTTLLDYRPRGDGTWDAIKFFTAAWLPIVPLRGLRIRPASLDVGIVTRTYNYEVIEEGAPPLGRVLWIYLLEVAGLVPLIYAFTHMDEVNRMVGSSGRGFFVTLAALVWFGFVMTRFVNADRAYKRAAGADAPAAG